MTPETEVTQAITRYWSATGKTYDRSAGHGLADPRERTAWDEALTSLLPPAPAVVLARDAGFVDVNVSTLEALERIEHAISPRLAQFGPRYVLTGTRPKEA